MLPTARHELDAPPRARPIARSLSHALNQRSRPLIPCVSLSLSLAVPLAHIYLLSRVDTALSRSSSEIRDHRSRSTAKHRGLGSRAAVRPTRSVTAPAVVHLGTSTASASHVSPSASHRITAFTGAALTLFVALTRWFGLHLGTDLGQQRTSIAVSHEQQARRRCDRCQGANSQEAFHDRAAVHQAALCASGS